MTSSFDTKNKESYYNVVEDGVYTPETNKINEHNNIDVLTAPRQDIHSRFNINWIY